ncbi:PHO85 cyclin-like protein psl1 [Choanephora cucurbitarum]|uniref:PHO85 cyclin-like protein psl1 n=1 Tax=Choanephora cucurbitarum TaxID=101091 RepID=A0A1C7NH93_9FUNG|nr:PHO85 cyclin-like protein psl1 [Choanephora cucurbitarum]
MTLHYDLVQYPATGTIKIITHLLERITKTNDRLQPKASRHTSPYACFYARAIPTIDIQAYLGRILKYCPCSNECFLSLLVYFDRMSRNSSGLRIDSYNIHRLVITGIMVASKFFSDIFYTNARYAKVGGLPVAELNALELQFLKLNNFNLNVQVEELQQYGDQLLWHWIRENQKLSLYEPTTMPIEHSKPLEPVIYKKIRSCSSHLILATDNVTEKYDSITRC